MAEAAPHGGAEAAAQPSGQGGEQPSGGQSGPAPADPAIPPAGGGSISAKINHFHAPDAGPFNPNATQPDGRTLAGGDVPVWPRQQLGDGRIPDLPFSPEVWAKKPDQPPSQALAIPGQQPPFGTINGPTPPNGAPVYQEQGFVPPVAPPAQPGKNKKALFAVLGVLVLAGVATGGFFAYRSMSAATPAGAQASTPAATQEPTPTETPSASPTADAAGTTILNSDKTDPKKLSLTEAFPQKKMSLSGTTFTRVTTDMETGCDKAASGPFADALKAQKCSRVLRATYVDSKQRYAVTTGIAVLPTKDAAVSADEAKNLSKNLWFRALPGAAGTGADRVNIAGGYAAGLVWGRYIVFSYATYADGHTPTAKEKALGKISGAFRDQTSKVLEHRITTS